MKRINVISIKMNIIDEVPNDDLEKKMLFQSCTLLLDISEKYNLYKKLQEKISILKTNYILLQNIRHY